MCGLFGMMGPGIIARDLDLLKELGTFSQVRGYHGSGIYQVRSTTYGKNSNSNELIYKGYETFSELLLQTGKNTGMKQAKDILNTVNVDVIIGHVRWATKGDVTDENSHPFAFHNLVGAHNGTLRDSKYDHKEKTDSELMFSDISARGLRTVLTELDGDSAYAITLYDRVQREVIFVRNELRPLAFAFLEDRSVMYWASDMDMLKYTLWSRGNLKAKYYNLRPGGIIKIRASDISCKNNADNPLKCMRRSELENRPLPSFVKKMMEEEEKQKREEEEKKRREENKVDQKSTTVTTKQNGWTDSLVITREGNVLHFVPQDNTPSIITQAFRKCDCGKCELNPAQADRARRGVHASILYDDKNDMYLCDSCVAPSEKKFIH